MSKIIIGFTGKLESGKTSAGKLLINEYGFHRYRFADIMKRMLKKMGLTDAQVDGDEKEKPSELLGGKTPRYAMQTLGTEWGRNLIDSDLWVRAGMHAIERMPERVVIDDVRFLNEANAINDAGGLVIRVLRTGQEKKSISGHASETEMDKIPADYTIGPAVDVPQLHAFVHTAMTLAGVKKPEVKCDEKKCETKDKPFGEGEYKVKVPE